MQIQKIMNYKMKINNNYFKYNKMKIKIQIKNQIKFNHYNNQFRRHNKLKRKVKNNNNKIKFQIIN